MIDFHEFKSKYQNNEVVHFPNIVPEKILVSVLVQTYNHEKYIENCLNSILSQKTSFKFEIILGEDCSEDNTRAICIKYAENYPDKIRLLLHRHENKIMVENHLTGNFNAFYNFFNARGKYIAFCEGDDFWMDENKLQKQIEFLEGNPQFILSYHSYKIQSKNFTPKENSYSQPKGNLSCTELVFLKEHPLLLTICFRNQLDRLPSELLEVINIDAFLISILGNFGNGYYHFDIDPAISRKHSGGIWSSKKRIKQLEIKLHTFKKLEFHYNSKNKQAFNYFRRIRKQQAKMLLQKACFNFKSKAFFNGLKNFF